ncbi:MAG: response regulator [Puniceicoccaceae bacterium]
MAEKILVLEDDQAFAQMLVESLEANGLEAEVSLDPEEALERVRSDAFDLLVSDYLMPKQDGTAFVRQVRRFDGAIPVIMISAFMGGAEMRQAAEAGVTRVLRKPFRVDELIGEIRQLLKLGPVSPVAVRPEGRRSGGEFTFPRPLRFLRAHTRASQGWIQDLWEAGRSGKPVFLVGEKGFELDLVVAELAAWADPEGGAVSFDFQASALFSPHARSLVRRFAGRDSHSRVVIGRGIDEMERSAQKVLKQMLEHGGGYPDGEDGLTFVFPLTSDRLALAEMSMEEELLEMVFGNLVKVPPLRGRHRDIAAYLSAGAGGEGGPVFSPGAAAFLLRYDWPGNFDELMKLRRRLAAGPPGAPWSEAGVRSALEKRLTEPLDARIDFSLGAVLTARQREYLETLALRGKGAPGEILRRAGCPEAAPSPDFPAGQKLLHPELLGAAETD